MSRRRPTPRPAVCGHFLPANKQITRQLSSSSGGNYRSFGSLQWGHSGDTVGTLGHWGQLFLASSFQGALIGSLAPGRPFKGTPLGYSCHLVIRRVWFDRHYIARVSVQLLGKECRVWRNWRAAVSTGCPCPPAVVAHHCPQPGFRLPRQGCSVKVVVAVGDGTATARRSASKSPQMSHRLT